MLFYKGSIQYKDLDTMPLDKFFDLLKQAQILNREMKKEVNRGV